MSEICNEYGEKVGLNYDKKIKKVYCKNCLFPCGTKIIETSRKRETIKLCDPHKTIKRNNLGIVVEYDLDRLFICEEMNRNNDCIFYKRKWWKFWVK